MTSKGKAAAVLAMIASALAVLLTMKQLGFWDVVGWTTPAQHNADMAEVNENHDPETVVQAIQQIETKLSAQIAAQAIQVQTNRDEWWCDEEEEFLDDLIRLKDAGNDSEAIQQEIREQRQKMDAVQCYRFDND